MENFNVQRFVEKMAGLAKSPSDVIRTAIDEKDYINAAASVVCGNIIILLIALSRIFFGVMPSPVEMVKGLIMVDIFFAVGAWCYFIGGRLMGGTGSIEDVAIACAMVCAPIMAINGVLPTLTVIALKSGGGIAATLIPVWKWVARVLPALINFFALKESHGFDTSGKAFVALIVSEIIIMIAMIPLVAVLGKIL